MIWFSPYYTTFSNYDKIIFFLSFQVRAVTIATATQSPSFQIRVILSKSSQTKLSGIELLKVDKVDNLINIHSLSVAQSMMPVGHAHSHVTQNRKWCKTHGN